MTDGVSNIDNDRVETDAETAMNRSITLYTVAITSSVDLKEIKAITSPPKVQNQNWWQVADFASLSNIYESLAAVICTAPELSKPFTFTNMY